MRIDFHQTSPTHEQRHVPSKPAPLSPRAKKIMGIGIALLGILLVVYAIISLLTPRSSAPYALLFFEQADLSKPQATAHIVWINEGKNSVMVTQIPDGLEFHSQSLGTYPISSILAAHTTTKQSHSDFLTDLSFFFRFPIKATVHSVRPVSASKFSLARFTMSSCLRSSPRTLTIGECLRLIPLFLSFSTNVRELTFPAKALGKSTIGDMQPLDRDVYRDWSQANFAESFRIWKKYTVAILNGTKTSGLATNASLLLQDFGLVVLSVGEAQSPQKDGEIILNTKANEQKDLVDFLGSSLRLPTRVDDELTNRYRSDVVVIVGESEIKFFTP